MTSSGLTSTKSHAGPIIPFENSYARLPTPFYEHARPAPVAAPKLLRLNEPLADQLRIDPEYLKSPHGIDVLAGNAIAAGSEPIALAYAGHQFGHFVPQLGDGRAVMLGEVVDATGRRFDVQLKGSGPTPFSRRGDGRAALGPVLREYLVSEAMAALGVATTRSLAAVLTGDAVVRERLLPGAVLTRIASSHLRIGTFQYFAARRDTDNLRRLADYAIDRHYPDARNSNNAYLAFFAAVVSGLADLVAHWMRIGFIHGVLNTDNISIAAETIDYGPCAFMDAYHSNKVFSSIDQFGRYAFANQPGIMKWNLARLAETLLTLFADDAEKAVSAANETLGAFDARYFDAYAAGMRGKLGLARAREGDDALMQDLLQRMADQQADFTMTFRTLCEASLDPARDADVRVLFDDPGAYDAWAPRWRARLLQEDEAPEARRVRMRSVNPMFIPRNHRIEEAIRDAEAGRYEAFHQLNDVLARPYDDQPNSARYAQPPAAHEEVQQTFCGT